MIHFAPVLPTGHASKNARTFVTEYKELFWNILKPLIPYILALNLFDALITGLFLADSEGEFQVGAMLSSYFIGVLAITWHRVVIHGPDNYEPMNIFKPKKHELAFILAPALLTVLYFAVAAILIILSAALSQILAVLIGLAAVIFGVIGAMRISFYLPGKAVNANMTFKKSWHMTKGYIWRLMTAGFYAIWRVLLICMLYLAGAVFIASTISAAAGMTGFILPLILFIAFIPFNIFFEPLLTVLGVTVLSNYYQWAINNPRPT